MYLREHGSSGNGPDFARVERPFEAGKVHEIALGTFFNTRKNFTTRRTSRIAHGARTSGSQNGTGSHSSDDQPGQHYELLQRTTMISDNLLFSTTTELNQGNVLTSADSAIPTLLVPFYSDTITQT